MSPLFVEFHVLRSFVPSNLNRDDLGSPKSALFGGVRRLRISSQCLKRTMRLSETFTGTFSSDQLGLRTKFVGKAVLDILGAEGLKSAALEKGLAMLLSSLGKKAAGKEDRSEDDAPEEDVTVATHLETAHLLYLGRHELRAVASFCKDKRAELEKLGAAKKPNADALRGDLEKALKKASDERHPVDISLFGRFLTSSEFAHVDASLQVAHAIGTQKVELETDYFTAMDDLGSEPGAGMLGETEFASSVLYCYAVCDVGLLQTNLKIDKDLAGKAAGAIAEALARAVPTGKKNSTAPHNPADYVEVVIRTDAPVSLANAFLSPAHPQGEQDVMDTSIAKLVKQAATYRAAYGDERIVKRVALSLRDSGKSDIGVASMKALREAVATAVMGAIATATARGAT